MKSTRGLAIAVAIVCSPVAPTLAQTSEQPISTGVPITRSIAGPDVHAYTFKVARNQVFTFVAMQKGVDVTLVVRAPDGGVLAERDSPNGTDGPEQITALAELTGRTASNPGSSLSRTCRRLALTRRAWWKCEQQHRRS